MKKVAFAIFAIIGISGAHAAYLPLPIMRTEYIQIKQNCLDGMMSPETQFPFVYDDYCGCVAQEIVGATKHHPEWLRDSRFRTKMQPIITAAYEYCNQYMEWKSENAQSYVKQKKEQK